MNTRKMIIWASVPLLIIALVIGGRATVHYNLQRARKSWAIAAVRQLAAITLTNMEIRTELDQIKHPTPDLDFGWAHEHVILMTNGEYLVYAWWHGANSGFVDHLFLARGTAGKWYFSTYHFCNQMAGILGDEPAGSIAEFAKRYSVREFDGKSEDCLEHTWPPKG
ncbi:hypothetical protein SBV1_130103 [Verrucomicrobia bacterium]|nr:hypothetical protein SBV1_130103 [Verrucomicrobiota bacterium]